MSERDERDREAPGAGEAPDEAAENASEEAAGEAAEERSEGAAQEGAEAPSEADEEAAAKAREEAAAKAKAAEAAKERARKAAEAKAKKEAEEAAKPPWERDPATPEWEEAEDDPLVRALVDEHGDAVVAARTYAGDLAIEVARESLRDVARTLKEEHGYRLPVDACGVDDPKGEPRFKVVYHLYHFDENRRIRLVTATDEASEVPSLTPLYRGLDWPEREVYDMFGVRFEGHPDMTRILLWEGFNGYPLRKDFPVEGIDTGSAIYPEYYEDDAGPVAGTGTGWKPEPPPEETEEAG